MRRPRTHRCGLLAVLALAVLVLGAACSKSNNKATATATPAGTALASPSASPATIAPAARGAFPTIAVPTFPATLPGTPGAGQPGVGPTLTLADLQRLALQVSDLPPGFLQTSAGPAGPELGLDLTASYQAEFQQSNVTTTQALQQTIVVINLLGQYKDAISATTAVKGVTVQNFNQLFGSSGLSAQQVPMAPIESDSAAYHFTGSFSNTPVGGYLIVFHRGSVAALVMTAAPSGAESLPQTIALAQTQDRKLQQAG